MMPMGGVFAPSKSRCTLVVIIAVNASRCFCGDAEMNIRIAAATSSPFNPSNRSAIASSSSAIISSNHIPTFFSP